MKIKVLLKNKILRNILSALAVAVFGFILLNLVFLFDFIFQSVIDASFRLFTQVDFNMELHWFPPMKQFLFVVIIGIISWFVFRSKLKVLYKAIFMTVPVAVVLATIGMSLYRWPIVLYSLGTLLCICTLYFFYRTKQPWLYYYTVILVSITLAIVTMMGVDI
jgi:hypothetical protein